MASRMRACSRPIMPTPTTAHVTGANASPVMRSAAIAARADREQPLRRGDEHLLDGRLADAERALEARDDASQHVVVAVAAEAAQEVLAGHVLGEDELVLVAALDERGDRAHLLEVAARAPGRREVPALVAEAVEADDRAAAEDLLVVLEVLD